MIGHISTLASIPEDLGHLQCRPALPVLTVATTVPGRFSDDYASGSSFSGVQARRCDEWRADRGETARPQRPSTFRRCCPSPARTRERGHLKLRGASPTGRLYGEPASNAAPPAPAPASREVTPSDGRATGLREPAAPPLDVPPLGAPPADGRAVAVAPAPPPPARPAVPPAPPGLKGDPSKRISLSSKQATSATPTSSSFAGPQRRAISMGALIILRSISPLSPSAILVVSTEAAIFATTYPASARADRIAQRITGTISGFDARSRYRGGPSGGTGPGGSIRAPRRPGKPPPMRVRARSPRRRARLPRVR
jgi:hypothetical protein